MSTKETCLAEMRASWGEMTAVVELIPRERLDEPGVVEGWSVRDMLAHMAGYERYVAAAIFADLTGVPATNQDFYGRDDAPSEADDANDDTSNAWVVAYARQQPLDAVLEEFRWAHNRLVEAVDACDEADFDDPARFPSMLGKSLAAVLPNQCWGHHREHLPQLVDWLSATPQPG
jgi:uncharacterized protein (TIGR03083 family)